MSSGFGSGLNDPSTADEGLGSRPRESRSLTLGSLPWKSFSTVVLLAALAVLCVRWSDALSHQVQNLTTLSIVLGAGVLLLLCWLLALRIPLRIRLQGFLCFLLVAGAAGSLVRLRGFSGDMVPILEWRFARSQDPVAPPRDLKGISREPSEDRSDAPVISGFPQFQGPNRDTVMPGKGVSLKDPEGNPPTLVWRRPIGAAWSGFSVMEGRAFTQEQVGEEEWVSCFDAQTGERLWHYTSPGHYNTPIAGVGPRATPTVAGDVVYSLGATGWLTCLEVKTGRPRWALDLVEQLNARIPEWGLSGSPWVQGDAVYVIAGAEDASVIALDSRDGTLLWKGGEASVRYSSLVLAELHGTSQLLAFNRSLESLDPETGRVLWSFPFGVGHPHVATPVVLPDNQILISAGYGVGTARIQVTFSEAEGWGSEEIWTSRRMKAKFASIVVRDGAVIGLDDGILAAIRLEDGSLLWKEGRHGHGQGLWVGADYLLMAENGELVHLRPNAEGPREQSRFRVFRDKTWNPIALAGAHLLVRNDREAACLRLPVDP